MKNEFVAAILVFNSIHKTDHIPETVLKFFLSEIEGSIGEFEFNILHSYMIFESLTR